jgi:hypothetical protein
VVPDFTEPQALNRGSYVRNNPLRVTDPTGQCIPGVDCPGDNNDATGRIINNDDDIHVIVGVVVTK